MMMDDDAAIEAVKPTDPWIALNKIIYLHLAPFFTSSLALHRAEVGACGQNNASAKKPHFKHPIMAYVSNGASSE